MKTLDPKELSVPALHAYTLAAVAPRPIAFASTIDKQGNVNLSPFSFFNAYSSNPPIMVFSSNRSGRTGELKHTYWNIKEVPEVVINIVTYDMVQQVSLASVEYPKGVNEFVKAGFTELASDVVRPPRVKESPVQFECKVNQVIELGDKGGAGNLFLCEILRVHVSENVLDAEGKIDIVKMDQVGRCGGDYYIRCNEQSMFKVPKPITTIGIGVDSIPNDIRFSHVLTGNDLGKLGNVEHLPSTEEIAAKSTDAQVQSILSSTQSIEQKQQALHQFAQQLLAQNEVMQAWAVLLQPISA